MSSSLSSPICHAELDWISQDDVEIPVSRQFGDVYFSKANGLSETRHVFLNGNELTERLAALTSHQYFCVGETGFGTGLNILALWQLWQQCRPDNHSRLHVITVEKYPLSCADLTRALNAWPELAELSQKLLAQYPAALPGCHRMIFADERFSIDLWLGDAADCLPEIQTNHSVDAWFMDGFAPKCNPELWQDNILKHLIRLSGPGTSFASFSVAGVVKQGLRAHGIKVTRPAGFGRKREMLKAWWELPKTDDAATRSAPTKTPPKIAIIGAGIAGLSMANALATRGYPCQLIDKVAPLAGASGNPRALLSPKLVNLKKFSTSLMNIGWLHTLRYWQQYRHTVELTGLLHILDKKITEQQTRAQQYTADILENLTAEQTAATAGTATQFASIAIKQAALLDPNCMAQHILASPLIEFVQAEVNQLENHASAWRLLNAQQEVVATAEHVIVCNALNAPQLCPSLPNLRPVRGQLSWFTPAANPTTDTADLAMPMGYGGYIAPVKGQNITLLGASFIRDDMDTSIRASDHQHNLELLAHVAPQLAHGLPPIEAWQGRASIRAQSPDYLPFVGAVPDMPKVWTLCGLGSKGFSFAPLCAEMICAQMLGEVWPVSIKLASTLTPKRFNR